MGPTRETAQPRDGAPGWRSGSDPAEPRLGTGPPDPHAGHSQRPQAMPPLLCGCRSSATASAGSICSAAVPGRLMMGESSPLQRTGCCMAEVSILLCCAIDDTRGAKDIAGGICSTALRSKSGRCTGRRTDGGLNTTKKRPFVLPAKKTRFAKRLRAIINVFLGRGIAFSTHVSTHFSKTQHAQS